MIMPNCSPDSNFARAVAPSSASTTGKWAFSRMRRRVTAWIGLSSTIRIAGIAWYQSPFLELMGRCRAEANGCPESVQNIKRFPSPFGTYPFQGSDNNDNATFALLPAVEQLRADKFRPSPVYGG